MNSAIPMVDRRGPSRRCTAARIGLAHISGKLQFGHGLFSLLSTWPFTKCLCILIRWYVQHRRDMGGTRTCEPT